MVNPSTPGEFKIIRDEEELIWDVKHLWEQSKDLPVTMMPLEHFGYVFDRHGSFGSPDQTLRQMPERLRSIMTVDLSYPIILSPDGIVMDGTSRLIKSLLEGAGEIPVTQFQRMPPPDRRVYRAAHPPLTGQEGKGSTH